jgi:hypothetical protein
MSATASIVPQPAPTLVNTLTQQFVNVVMQPAVEALAESTVKRVRKAIERHVNAGRLDTARALVSDEIMAACLSREIGRHIFDCPICADEDGLRCYVLSDMERREENVLRLISQEGGF